MSSLFAVSRRVRVANGLFAIERLKQDGPRWVSNDDQLGGKRAFRD